MRALAAAFALICATPVVAQERMTQALCDGSWEGVASLIGQPAIEAEVRLDDEDWCVIEDATIDIDAGSRFGLDQLRWRASDMERFVEGGLPPRSLEISVRGISVLPQTGDEVYDYLLALQMHRGLGLGFEVALRWDGLQKAVLIDTATLVFDATNRIEMTGRIDGVDLTDTASIQTSLGSAGLRDMLVKAQFDGWFESYVALPLGAALLQNDDVAPAAQVEVIKRQAIEFIKSLPDGLMPAPSRAALTDFITALPQPRGAAQLQLSAEPVLSAARLMPLALHYPSTSLADATGVALEGTTLLFTWAPTKETP